MDIPRRSRALPSGLIDRRSLLQACLAAPLLLDAHQSSTSATVIRDEIDPHAPIEEVVSAVICRFVDWPSRLNNEPQPTFLLIAFGAGGAEIAHKFVDSCAWEVPTLQASRMRFLTVDSLLRWLSVREIHYLVPVFVFDKEAAQSVSMMVRQFRIRHIRRMVAVAPRRALTDQLKGMFKIMFPFPSWSLRSGARESMMEIADFYGSEWCPAAIRNVPFDDRRERDVCFGLRDIWAGKAAERKFALVADEIGRYLNDAPVKFVENAFFHMTICQGIGDADNDEERTWKSVKLFDELFTRKFKECYRTAGWMVSHATAQGTTRFRITSYGPSAFWSNMGAEPVLIASA